MAQINVSPDYNYWKIIELAGIAVIPENYTFENGILTVESVSQEVLENAFIQYDHEEYLRFAQKLKILQELAVTDAEMARIAEDLISVLISKGTILENDLPEAARLKLQQRQTLRSEL